MAKPSQPVISGKKIEIPQDRYLADLELHDRFLALSGEVMRLGLGGITVTGLFLTVLAGKDTRPTLIVTLTSDAFWWIVALSLIFFAKAVVAALVHRFLASDGMYHHIRAIKLFILIERPELNPRFDAHAMLESIELRAARDESLRNDKLAWSERSLWASGACLIGGASCLGAAFLMLLK